MNSTITIGAIGLVKNRLDKRGQVRAPLTGDRQRSVAPLVIARGGHLQPNTHFCDGIPSLLRIDERELLAHRYSWAKKAAAFPKNSVFIRNSRTSRSSSRSRARSDNVNGGSSPACSVRYLLPKTPESPHEHLSPAQPQQ